MSLVLATGSNLANRKKNLNYALDQLEKKFKLIQASSVFESKAVDYFNQPDFLNQVLEFELPNFSPRETLKICLDIEKKMGRNRDTPKGPRLIDIDLIFYGQEIIDEAGLRVPHPAWNKRSFVVRPLLELPFAKNLSIKLEKLNFSVEAIKYD